MFTWICPKCGKEVPPSYSECPNCSATSSAAAPPTAEPAPVRPGPAEAPAQRRPAAKPESRLRHWLMGLVAALSIVVVVLTILVLVRGRRDSPAAGAAAAPTPAPLERPAMQQPPPANPAFKPLELTGFRITEDSQKKAQLQVVAVNHSGADLGDLKARVNLRAANSGPQDPPAASFNLLVSLGPYESKELKVPLETSLRGYELPDWQLLRAEVVPQ